MPKVVTKTIKTSGGDYSSLSAFEAGEQRDLVTADEIAVAEIDGAWGSADTIYVNLDSASWTTDATRYIRIYTTPTARHPGRWDTTKYRLSVSSQWNGVLRNEVNYTKIDGLQIENTWADAATGNVVGVDQRAHGDDTSNCLIRFGGGGTPSGTGDVGLMYDMVAAGIHRAWNNVIWAFSVGIYYDYGSSGFTFVLYNNTVANNLSEGIHIQDNAGDVALYLKNNICSDNVVDYSISAFSTYVHSNNISKDATSPDATFRSKTVIFVDQTNRDYHLCGTDVEARKKGVNLSADAQLAFSTDLDGQTRGVFELVWSIGADEFVSFLKTRSIKASGGDYTTLNAFNVAEASDLVHDGFILHGIIDGAWGSPDTAQCTMVAANWKTSCGNYIRIYTTTAARHKGRWTTTAYNLQVGVGWGSCLAIAVPFTEVDGLQFEGQMTSNGGGITITSTDCKVSNCIARWTGSSVNSVSGFRTANATRTKFWNCLAYDWKTAAATSAGFTASTPTLGLLWLYNCGAQNCDIGFVESFFDPVIKNCWAQDCTDGFSGSWAAGSDYNLSDLAADAPGGNSKNSTTIAFVDKANDDFHLDIKDTGACKSGVNLSADASLPFSTDNDGHARSTGRWDIGQDEFRAHEIVRTIKESAGGDYTTLASFLSAEARDLVNLGELAVAKITGSWASPELSEATISSSWITSDGNHLKIYTEGAARHPGRWSDTAFRIIPTLTSAMPIRVQGGRGLRIDGLQLSPAAGATTRNGISGETSYDWCRISNNIIRGVTGNVGVGISLPSISSAGKAFIWDNIVYDWNATNAIGIAAEQTGATGGIFVYDNTVYNCYIGIRSSGSLDIVAKNNIANACPGGCYTNAFNAASTNNLASDASAPGSNPQNNKTLVFIKTAVAPKDLRLCSDDTAAIGTGVSIKADSELPITTDINGKPRDPIKPCIGAGEFLVRRVTRSVKASGGDYSSLAAFIAGEVRDLTLLGEVSVGSISGSWVSAETAQVDITSGWYTCKGNGIEIATLADGARHRGRWSDTAYRIVVTSGHGININEISDVSIDGLQVHLNHGTSDYGCIFFAEATKCYLSFSNNILRGFNGAAGKCAGLYASFASSSSLNVIRSWNNLIYNMSLSGYKNAGILFRYGTWYVYNNTIANSRYGVYDDAGTGTCICKNVAVQVAGASSPQCFVGSFSGSSTNNLANDATAPGSNPQNNKTMTFVGAAASDYHLDTTDNVAQNKGANLRSDAAIPITTDLDGHTRTSTFDIGSDQFSNVIVERTIAESGGDYSSLNAAMTGEARDLVNLGEQCHLKITGTWSSAETTGITFASANWKTARGNRLKIYVARGDAARAQSPWSNTAYRAEIAALGGESLRIEFGFVDIEGLQVGHAGSWGSRSGLYLTGPTANSIDDITVSYCHFRTTGTDGSNSSAFSVNTDRLKQANSLLVKNCFVSEAKNMGFNFGNGPSPSARVHNCTARNCGFKGFWSYGLRTVLKNCLASGCTTEDFNTGMGDASSDYNVSGDATAPGANSRINQTVSFAGAGDCHLSSGDMSSRMYGTDLSSDSVLPVIDDFDGQTRVPPTDIGADEVLAKGGGISGMFNRGLV